MAEAVKISDASECLTCKTTPIQEQVVQCYVCKNHYHAYCDAAGNDNKLRSMTMIKTFLAASTKANFKFFCDICLTEYERNLVEIQNQKITALTEKVGKMETKLDEITKLLKSPQHKSDAPKPVPRTCWDDAEKLSKIKAPKPKPLLVIKKSNNENQNIRLRKLRFRSKFK